VSWTAADVPDQTGRVAVVTGANSGLGLETARSLAVARATVVMAVRDLDRAADAERDIRAGVPGAILEIVPLDLASLASVRAAADRIGAEHPSVDVLVNNAGLMAIDELRTEDGFEMQLGVDHLGHFALTAWLLPSLLRADAARVVTVTSTAHHLGRAVRLDPDRGRYSPWGAYGRAKLANFHFGIGLQRRFEDAGVRAASLVAHPGLTVTGLHARSIAMSSGGRSQRFWRWAAATSGMPATRGVLPQLRAATDPTARGGEFYAPRYGNRGPPVRRPVLRRIGLTRAIDRLWVVSERSTGASLDAAAIRAAVPSS
jgi:NAD(P)-dependent dehydrogenase (short-subunit alcohol dehydrogenase family)